MSLLNGYCTLSELRTFTAPQDTSVDAVDDAVLESLIEGASRLIDDLTGRKYYPRVETHYFSHPENTESRLLFFDDDLLAVSSVLNGDDVAITAYNLLPKNVSPKYGLLLKETSGVSWQLDSSGNSEFVIEVSGTWGFHSAYATQALKTGSTLNEGGTLNATDLTFTVTAGSPFEKGNLILAGTEWMCIKGVVGEDLTVIQRGENGSTAATHADGSTIYIWQYEQDIKLACLYIAMSADKRRAGENLSAVATVTNGGVVITPRDIPDLAWHLIKAYKRML
jgi:hypothetical protein